MVVILLPVFSFKGIRDDLACLLDEDLSCRCLCALHCEVRNTEQILKSVGLLAYKIQWFSARVQWCTIKVWPRELQSKPDYGKILDLDNKKLLVETAFLLPLFQVSCTGLHIILPYIKNVFSSCGSLALRDLRQY